MSEENKSRGFFSFIWKSMITIAMLYGIAYAMGFDKKLLGFFCNSVVPELKNTVDPIAKKAKVMATNAAEVALEKGKVVAKDLGDKAKTAINKAKNDISEKINEARKNRAKENEEES